MLIQRAAPGVAGIVLLLVAATALAFVDPPMLVPANPVAGQTVSVSVRVGNCDFFTEREGYPRVTKTGSVIRIVLSMVVATNGQFCSSQPATMVFPVGVYPEGGYTLQVDRIYVDELNGGDVVEALATLPFTVSPAQPARIPASTPLALVILGFALLVIALASRRKGAWLALLALSVCGTDSSPIHAQATD